RAAGRAAPGGRRGAERGELQGRARRAPSPALCCRLRRRRAGARGGGAAAHPGRPRPDRPGGDGERAQGEGPPGGPGDAGGRRGPRGEHADHRHLELRPDAPLRDRRERSPLRDPQEGGAPDFPRRAHRQQSARVRAQPPERAAAGGAPAAALRVDRPPGRPPGPAAHRAPVRAAIRKDRRSGLRRRAAAGLHQPAPERRRRHGRDRRPAHRRHRGRRRLGAGAHRRHRAGHPAGAAGEDLPALLLDQAGERRHRLAALDQLRYRAAPRRQPARGEPARRRRLLRRRAPEAVPALGMNILIVDDEEVLQDVLTALIRRAGHTTLSARTGEEALEMLEREEVDLVLLDLMLPGLSGQQVLRQIRQRDPAQVVVVITAYSSIESAIDARREGAFHYIPKPFKNEEVLLTIRKGLEQRRLATENRDLRQQLRQRFGLDNLVGKSKPMQQVYDLIQLAAPAKSTILILGESGTGKELVAKAIHHHSRRADGPFVTVNSGSMPADLLESNLFGHVKGAFTGAIASKKGLFELATGGSIFFDEIGNIPLDTQAKLLRVIQEKEFMRLGGIETVRVDVRIIAATNADLEDTVQEGLFREDLYYRLNVITVTLPPLRKRSEDIPLLAQHFLAYYA